MENRFIKKLWMKMMMPCEQATFLIAKKDEAPLSIFERLSILVHTLTCTACKNFMEQMKYISKEMKQINKSVAENISNFSLTDQEKINLQASMENEIKKE